jgi:DNA-binding NtrC family response regulator
MRIMSHPTPTSTLDAPTERLATTAQATLAPVLIVLRPPEGPERASVLMRGSTLVVGSGREATLSLREPSLSRRHASVSHEGPHIRVADLGSTNGVLVGGVRVTVARLVPGARIRVGRVELAIRPVSAAPEVEPLPGLIGRSPPMLALAERVRRFAGLSLAILIRGESGTGKDLVARAIHTLSGRRGPFVPLNAATVTRELAESELFGHRRGAFTGAFQDRRGAFREADGGTLFIDEVASLPLDVQAKLLRAVEDGMVRPVGAEGPVRVDVRIVAATCEPLEDRVGVGAFRADLYERLAACIVRVPALRERVNDVGDLAAHLVAGLGLGTMTVSPEALLALERMRFRGNVRELRSLLTHAALAAAERGEAIGPEHVSAAAAERGSTPADPELLRGIVEAYGGNVSLAARRAGIPRSTLRDLLARRDR